MKTIFFQLESDAFRTDMDFVQFWSAERGAYCSLIFFLISNDGKCRFDPPTLSRMCDCQSPEDFEEIWERISKNFQTRDGVIRH